MFGTCSFDELHVEGTRVFVRFDDDYDTHTSVLGWGVDVSSYLTDYDYYEGVTIAKLPEYC